ncbi:MAG: ROK family protein [Melioribacteraceae bacterium]|nr:ROK family protein [Melioribacteraceae bacterium]MCF8355636.1 ROK family protein [Melioribacteraceae bacterium]MCF8394664.1 ROK family protein [Melioribacteraceae bacterium]MCF8418002.1 ROK family protein [Melioribacteraceae bacterium]
MPKKQKFAIGVDLGGTNIKFGLVTDKGKIIKKETLDARASKGPDAVISQIKKGVASLLYSEKTLNVAGIGIGSPGTILIKKGTVQNPPNFPGWESIPLGKIIKKEFNIPTFVENDANAAAIGEMIFGAGKKLNSFIMVTLGTGVGGGIIIDKKLYRGDTGGAGEIGHVTINHSGKKCNCGSRGCIEAYVGNNYLIRDVRRSLRRNPESILYKYVNSENKELSPKLIHEAALENDEFSLSIISGIGENLGYGLSSVINLLDISNVIIGGGVAGFGDMLFVPLKASIQSRVMKSFKERIKVKEAKLKNEAGIKGASALVFYRS